MLHPQFPKRYDLRRSFNKIALEIREKSKKNILTTAKIIKTCL